MNEYQHATCHNKYPQGSLEIGDEFTTICGETVTMTGVPNKPKCPECLKLFGKIVQDRSQICKVCNKSGREHS